MRLHFTNVLLHVCSHILQELLTLKHLDFRDQSHIIPAYTRKVIDYSIENPIVTVSGNFLLGQRILLNEQVLGSYTQLHANMGVGITRHTEYISPLLAVADFIFPCTFSNLYLAYSLHLEQLVALAFGVVCPNFDEVISEPEWLHETVTNHIAIRRLVIMKDDHFLLLSCFPEVAT